MQKNCLVHFKFIARLPGTHFGVVKCLQKSFLCSSMVRNAAKQRRKTIKMWKRNRQTAIKRKEVNKALGNDRIISRIDGNQ